MSVERDAIVNVDVSAPVTPVRLLRSEFHDLIKTVEKSEQKIRDLQNTLKMVDFSIAFGPGGKPATFDPEKGTIKKKPLKSILDEFEKVTSKGLPPEFGPKKGEIKKESLEGILDEFERVAKKGPLVPISRGPTVPLGKPMPKKAWRVPEFKMPLRPPRPPPTEYRKPKPIEMKEINKGMDSLTGKLRRLGFTSFIASFILGRLINTIVNLGKSVIGLIFKLGSSEFAMSEMESIITALALSGKATGESIKGVVDWSMKWREEAIKFEGSIAEIKASLLPLIVALLQGFNPALQDVTKTIQDAVKDPAVIEKFKEIGEALGKVLKEISSRLVQPEILDKVIGMIYFAGGIIVGVVDAAIALFDMLKGLGKDMSSEALFELGRGFGFMAGMVIVLATALQALVAPLTFLIEVLGLKWLVSKLAPFIEAAAIERTAATTAKLNTAALGIVGLQAARLLPSATTYAGQGGEPMKEGETYQQWRDRMSGRITGSPVEKGLGSYGAQTQDVTINNYISDVTIGSDYDVDAMTDRLEKNQIAKTLTMGVRRTG